MRNPRSWKVLQAVAYGAILFQMGGCSFEVINEYVQTILLGITAAGAVAIIQNV